MRKLSGWTRIVIVASVLWIGGGFVYGFQTEPSPIAMKQACDELALKDMVETKLGHFTPKYCLAQFQLNQERYLSTASIAGLIGALVFTPGLIIIWGTFGVVRWVRAGFVK